VVCELKLNKNNKDNNNLNIFFASLPSKNKVYDDETIAINDLRQTDIDILKVLIDNGENENTMAIFSFNGLKIKLNLHQEILSRSLKRLRELELIEKTKYGYKATKNGEIIFSKLDTILNNKQISQRKYTQILQVCIPFKIINQQLVENLAGKWFNNLRWIGMIQNLTGYQLKWKDVENFIEIVVHISDNNIIIETNDNNSLHISKAFSYSTKILDWISEIIIEKNLLIYSINNRDFNRITN
jgi:DNA-binding HxlR family transcriptional regulator